jgi:hypothetical protein
MLHNDKTYNIVNNMYGMQEICNEFSPDGRQTHGNSGKKRTNKAGDNG